MAYKNIRHLLVSTNGSNTTTKNLLEEDFRLAQVSCGAGSTVFQRAQRQKYLQLYLSVLETFLNTTTLSP